MTISLEKKPTDKNSHLYADWVEWLCLRDGSYTPEDLKTQLQLLEDLDGGVDQSIDADEKYESIATDTFRQLQYRHDTFADAYPFDLKDSGTTLDKLELTPNRRVYLALLLASSSRWFEQSDQSKIRQNFETLTLEAAQVWLADGFEVQLFGTSASPGATFSGSFGNRVEKLASILGLPTTQRFNPSQHNVGDGGLDVVAWPKGTIGTGADDLRIFIQAATGLNFLTKQTDMQHDKWRNWIEFHGRAAEVLSIPYCFRNSDGSWCDDQLLTTTLLDRVRLVPMLSEVVTPGLLNELLDAALDELAPPT